MNSVKFCKLFIDAGFSDEKALANFFEVTEKTVHNWKKRHPPKAVRTCLGLMAGKLGYLDKPWQGYRLTPEAIESPEGDFIYAYEVRAIKYLYLSAGIERARLCTMLKNSTPINERNRCLKPGKPTLTVVTDNPSALNTPLRHRHDQG